MTAKPKHLYSALGVSPSADTSAIRKAYRKAAKKGHPDAGGSREAFALVSRAVLVLTDPKSRERYDATGDDSGPSPDNDLGFIMQMMRTALQAVMQKTPDPYKVDLIAAIAGNFEEQIAAVRKDVAAGEAEIKRLTKFASKFRSKKRPNYLRQMIESDAAKVTHSIAQAQPHIANLERAIAIVCDHEFEVEKVVDQFAAFQEAALRSGYELDFGQGDSFHTIKRGFDPAKKVGWTEGDVS